ncbi:MAG: hypothetical protein CMF74_05195 [Maricaulis sp.]|nr:hypothetical protein [Maricaulis sp.]
MLMQVNMLLMIMLFGLERTTKIFGLFNMELHLLQMKWSIEMELHTHLGKAQDYLFQSLQTNGTQLI